LRVEDWGVWVFCFGIRHFVLSDLAGVRIEFADVRGKIAGVPDVAFAIGDQAVRAVVFAL
jgi:hypothetical protein